MMFRDASGFSTTAVRSPFRGGFVHRGSGAEAWKPRPPSPVSPAPRMERGGRVPRREWKGG